MIGNLIDRIVRSPHPYVIAEIGINHNGEVQLAQEMIVAAKGNGADCVKFQSFKADKYISEFAGKAQYQQADTTVTGKSQKEIIKSCELHADQMASLKQFAEAKGIDFFSTPFEVWSFRELQQIGVPGIKISSCNLTNLPMLEEIAASGLPVLLSTGMAELHEVIRAVDIFKNHGSPLLLFQCTSNYPSKIENANLRTIPTFGALFQVPVGFSDHTMSHTAAIVAVALGAVAVEKHFTLSKNLPGIDQKASIEPQELRELVTVLREARASLGSPLKKRTDEEENTLMALRRSLVAARDLNTGDVFSEDMFAIKRPGTGLPAEVAARLLGARITRVVKKDMPLSMDDFLSK